MEGLEPLESVLIRLSPTWEPSPGEVAADDSFEDRVGRAVRASGLPLATRTEMRLRTYDPDYQGRNDQFRKAKKEATRLAHGEPPFMLTLNGPVGVGKTHLAIAVGWEWAEKGALVTYTRVDVMVQNLKRAFDGGSELTFDEQEDRLHSTHLLILDDLGATKLTDWDVSRLDEIVDWRWLNRMPLIITTNATYRDDLPQRLADRMEEESRSCLVVMKGPSHRAWRPKGSRP